MNKLRLSLEQLRVESFDTARTPSGGGTVHAHAVSNARCNSEVSCLPDTCYWETCMNCDTIGGCETEQTCAGTACTSG